MNRTAGGAHSALELRVGDLFDPCDDVLGGWAHVVVGNGELVR